jgi:hypothetical protein
MILLDHRCYSRNGGSETIMPKRHTIRQGECIASLAVRYGHFPETIWLDADNTNLRKERGNPDVLREGDVVTVPDIRPASVSVATESRHRFRRKGVPAVLSLRLLLNNEPRAGKDYVLEIDGRSFYGKTDGDGWIKQPIPPDASVGLLILEDGQEEHHLQLGYLDPIDTTRGVQMRLAHLGLYEGEIDDQFGPLTEEALRDFQERRNLEATGEPDEATRSALLDAYGS